MIGLPDEFDKPFLQVAAAGKELCQIAAVQHSPPVNDADPVAKILDVAEDVGTEKDRFALTAQLGDEPLDQMTPQRIEAAHGLVEDQ